MGSNVTNEELHNQIKLLLEKNGELGVNQLQKYLNIPLSTLQRYLDKQQTYFKKNEQRRWVLPEQALITEQAVMSEKLGDVVEGQIKSINAQVDMFISTLKHTVIIMENSKPKPPPVADKKMHPRLVNFQDKMDNLAKIIKSKKENLEPELYKTLMNTKWADLCLDMGANYVNDELEPALYDLLLGQTDNVDESIFSLFKEYQKGQDS